MRSVLVRVAGVLVSCSILFARERRPAVYDPVSLATELRQLRDALDHQRSATLSLPSSWEVETPEGSFSISTKPLKTLLDNRAPLQEVQAWLDYLAMHLSGFRSARPAGSENSRAILNGILARREFAGDAPPTPWDLFWERVNAWVKHQIEKLFTFAGRHPVGSWIVFWLVVLGALATLAFVLIRVWTTEERLSEMPLSSGPFSFRTWEQWIIAARAAADAGDLPRAIQCAYWAGIARLQETGTLPPNLTSTPREYLRFLSLADARRSGILEPLASLTSHLERFWYARLAVEAQDFRACLASLEALGCWVR